MTPKIWCGKTSLIVFLRIGHFTPRLGHLFVRADPHFIGQNNFIFRALLIDTRILMRQRTMTKSAPNLDFCETRCIRVGQWVMTIFQGPKVTKRVVFELYAIKTSKDLSDLYSYRLT